MRHIVNSIVHDDHTPMPVTLCFRSLDLTPQISSLAVRKLTPRN